MTAPATPGPHSKFASRPPNPAISAQRRRTAESISVTKDGAEPTEAGGVRAVSRALEILGAFVRNKQPRSLAQLSRETGLDKGTTRRLSLTLIQHRFLHYDLALQLYRLGPRILELAGSVTAPLELRELVRPILVRLGDEAGTTVHLAQEREGEALCVDRYQTDRAVVLFPHWGAGGRTMLNSGAAPWLLFASLVDERVEALLAEPAQSALLAKPVVPQAIRAKIGRIRRDGWVLSINELADGLTALAVPLRSTAGEIIAAISLVGLTPAMLVRGKPRHLALALQAAEEASRLVQGAIPALPTPR